MAGGFSTVKVTFDQRYKINKIKEQYAKKFGKNIRDQDLMQILLDTYEKHQHKDFIEEAKKLIELAKETVVKAEDYEKLKEENEQLRREIELLKESKKSSITFDIESLTTLDEKEFKKVWEDLKRTLRCFLLALVNREAKRGKWAILSEEEREMLYAIEDLLAQTSYYQFYRMLLQHLDRPKKREPSDAGFRGGAQLW
ncbi:hypothetical protein [Archaeoglobus profundus]|uniref:Uncharacterized protein n=1 Tax=Archaeoglobus profundus (strain DSM 5631 / JCM 9629 / NBRC 100127 / Av18) TaxID=572546 RepID=D2REL6_ARCPA|nr:hypothetical protein [Archaeoglobus profundus]ADB58560.1 hypothetical protein Arcpr_1514 [Archaeoglobus profundus DSM 5631]